MEIEKNNIVLNNEQQEALNNINTWLENPDDLFFTLGGAAGTGKSTLIGKLLEKYKKPVVVTAPTHKAKRVIVDKAKKPGSTIQALLGLRPNTSMEDFDIVNPEFFSKAVPQIVLYSLVIIDEASMINSKTFELISKEASKYKSKILFTGDQYQLTPVKENKSIVFTTDEINNKYFLTKVERQSNGNPLMDIYTSIRSDITSQNDLFKHISTVNDKGEGIEFIKNPLEFSKQTIELVKNDSINNKILCWTNSKIYKWNSHIRNSIFKNPKIIEDGEILLSYTSVQGNITNSSEYRVKVLEEITREDIKILKVELKDTYDDIIIENNIVIPNIYNYAKFLKQFTKYLNYARKYKGSAWDDFYRFKGQYLLLTDIKDRLGNTIVKKDLDYAYALSIHKSQGSTYKEVLVDETDINKNWNKEERNRLKYVAFSRPSKKAIVLT